MMIDKGLTFPFFRDTTLRPMTLRSKSQTSKFNIKVLRYFSQYHIFPNRFMFGMLIEIGPKFLLAMSRLGPITLRSQSLKFFVEILKIIKRLYLPK